MSVRHNLLSFLALVPLAACASHSDQRSGIVRVAADDPAMATAIDAARRSARVFAGQVGSPSPPYEYAAIKVRLADRGIGEHLWARNPRLLNHTFTAVLDNDPVDQKGRADGDTIRVDIDSISDWMLIRGDTIFGGFTVYALRDAMGPSARAEFEAGQPAGKAKFGKAALIPSPQR